tara:strand:- start:352 stop:654 length:303 start_codon:yes stop_codon:yes gene_type:complete
MKKIKEKWGITSNAQLIIIFIVFGITGSLSLIVTQPLLDMIGFKKGIISLWLYIPLKLILIFPAYQVILIIIGTIFGQFRFFWNIEKKMFARLGFKNFKS